MRASNISRPLSSSDSEEMSPAVDVVALWGGFMGWLYEISNKKQSVGEARHTEAIVFAPSARQCCCVGRTRTHRRVTGAVESWVTRHTRPLARSVPGCAPTVAGIGASGRRGRVEGACLRCPCSEAEKASGADCARARGPKVPRDTHAVRLCALIGGLVAWAVLAENSSSRILVRCGWTRRACTVSRGGLEVSRATRRTRLSGMPRDTDACVSARL